MGSSDHKNHGPRLFTLAAAFFLAFFSPVFSWGADNFSYISPPSTAVTYQVNQSTVTFNVQALTGATLDGGFNDSVVIALYDSTTNLISDSAASIYSNGVTYVGTGTFSFSGGNLGFGIAFEQGSDSEYVSIGHPTITTGAAFPSSGQGYVVQGFSTAYYAKDFDLNNVPDAYPTPGRDLLVSDAAGMTFSLSRFVAIPTPSGVTDTNTGIDAAASSYAVTGINGGYAFGGGSVSMNLWLNKASNSSGGPVSFAVILDYDGSLSNYNQPLSTDTVLEGVIDDGDLDTSATSFNPTVIYIYGNPNTPSAPGSHFGKAMQNGQVILRLWGGAAANPVSIRYTTGSSALNNLSSASVPYSSANASPVTAAITPGVVLANNSTSLSYVLTNRYNSPVSYLTFQVPVSWVLSNVTTTATGVSPSIASAPTNSAPGTVVVNTNSSSPLATGQSITLTLSVQAPNLSQPQWPFPILSALTPLDLPAPYGLTGPFVDTLAPPGTPTGFSAAPVSINQGGNAVSLNWGAVAGQGVTAYVVNRIESGGPFPVTQAGTFYIDSSAVNQSAYHYTVESQNAVADSGAASAGPVTPYANPGPPTGVNALSGGTSVQLNWTAPNPVSGSYPAGGFLVYRSTQANMSGAVTVGQPLSTDTTFNDTGLAPGDYYYMITSIDSQFSNGATAPTSPHVSAASVTVHGEPPGFPPTGIMAVLTSTTPDTLTVSWTAPIGDLGSISNFYLYRGVNGVPVTTGAPYATLGSSTVSYDDLGVSAGNTYQYEVAAIYPGPVSTNFSAIAIGNVGPPAPGGLTAIPSNSSVALSWSTDSQPVTEYILYRNSTPVGSVATPTLSFTDSTAPADTTLSYQVAAVDNTGVTGALSTPAVTTARLPNTPSGLSALADGTAPRTQADISWDSTSETLVNGYKLYRGTSSVFPPANPVTTSLGLVTAFPDPGLTPGTIYYYFLKAQNTLGGLSSLAGPIGIQVPPAPPTGLTAVSSAAAVTLTWNSNASGNAVQHYSVYRTGGTGPATFSPVSPSGGAAVTYNDLTASPGVDYAYHVTATNIGSGVTVAGGESSSSAIVTWGLKPQAPTGLTASVNTSNNITLNWSAITDANAQSVSVLVDATPTAMVTPSVTTYSYAGLPDTTYTFGIETNNAYGQGAITQVSILTYPGAPTISFLGQTNSGSVTITWNTQTSPTNYKIYRQQGAGASQPLTTVSAAGLAFPVTLSYSTLPGQTYTYYVSAVNATGEGPMSGGRLLQDAPSAPSGLTALSGVSPSTVQVNLSWAANGGTEGVTGYTVYRASAATGPFTALAPSPSGTTFSDSSVSGDTVYYYQVSAESGGIESFLNNANAVAVTAYEAPNTPVLPSITAGDQQLTLNWTAVSQTTYPVAGYNLYRSNSASVTGPKVNATPVPGISFTNTGLTDGTTYYYFLQTADNQGHGSSYAGPVSETPVKAPGAPTNVTSKPGDGAAQITWTASVPGTLPIGSYLLIRDDITASSVVTLGPFPVSPTGYVDTGLSNTHTYVYQVQAVDNTNIESGVHESSLSAPTTVSPGISVNPPSSMNAVGAPAAVTLTWVDSFVGPLNGPVTGYQIFRSTSQTGSYTPLPSGISVGVQTYTDSTVTNGTTYYYYMVASNNNSTPIVSPDSVTVHATPAGAPAAPSGLTALDGDQTVSLTWAPNPVLNNVAVSYYVVNRANLPGAPAAVANVLSPSGAATVVSFPDSGLSDGQTYVYTLQAVNANGTVGTASGPVTGYPYLMSPTTGLSSASDATGVNLSWNNVPIFPGTSSFPVTAFAVFRNDFGATVVYSPASALTVVSTTPFSDLTGTLGQLYDYQVAGMDDKGHLGPVSIADPDGKANPPPAPTSFTALAGDQEIILDWAPVVKTTTSLPVSYYILTSSTDNLAVTLTGQTYYEDVAGQNGSTLSNDNPVTYTLVSVDASGQYTVAHMSAAAGPVTGTSNSANVNPPTNVKAQAVTTNEIELTWTPANYENKSISYYNVYRASSFTGSYSKIAKVNNPLATPATVYDNTSLSSNTTYYYFVRSFDSISSKESCDSNHAYATTAAPTAGMPSVTVGELAFDKNLFLPLTGQQLSIYYVVPNSGWVELTVYNISGYPIRYFYPGNATANVQAGTVWDGKDRNGNTVASGIYLIEIKAPGFHQVRKVAVVK